MKKRLLNLILLIVMIFSNACSDIEKNKNISIAIDTNYTTTNRNFTGTIHTYPTFSSASSTLGSYFDEAKKGTVKTLEYSNEKIFLKYEKTEILSELPVKKRADDYGIYDIYIDNDEIEYLFLYNSDLFCGFWYNASNITKTKEKLINIETAIEIAQNYIKKIRDDYTSYEFVEILGDDNTVNFCYEIYYYKPISRYKSDDILRIWIDTTGEIVLCTEFNYKRYDDVKYIDGEKVKNAEEKILRSFDDFIKNGGLIEVQDSYISFSDKGQLELVLDIIIRTPSENNDGYSVYAHGFRQLI